MSKHEFFRFQDAVLNHQWFYKDRPLLSHTDQSAELLLSLLSGEIGECLLSPNEHGEIEGFPLRDYRQQELSDVWIFSLSLYLKYVPEGDTSWMQLLEQEAHTLSCAHRNMFPHAVQSSDSIPEIFQDSWSAQHERIFQCFMKNILWHQEKMQEAIESGDNEKAKKNCEFLLQFSWSALQLFISDPGKAILEKIVRNMLKYVIAGANGSDYKKYARSRKTIWSNTRGNEEFYGLEKQKTSKPAAAFTAPAPSVPFVLS